MKLHSFILTIFFTSVFLTTYAQKDLCKIKKLRLHPCIIDTTALNILIIDKRYVKIYFSQKKLLEYINKKNKNSDHKYFQSLDSLLLSGKQKIELEDWWYSYDDQDRKDMFGTPNYTNKDEKFIDDLQYLGDVLIIDGEFMLYDKTSQKFNPDNIKAKRVKDEMGTITLVFLLSNRYHFWYHLCVLGE